MMAKRDKWGVFMQVLCLGLAFFMLFPILYAVSVSLMEQKAVLASPPHFLPPKVTFDNYVTAFTRTTLPRYMVNSKKKRQRRTCRLPVRGSHCRSQQPQRNLPYILEG